MKRCPQCDISYPDSKKSCRQCGFTWDSRDQFISKLKTEPAEPADTPDSFNTPGTSASDASDTFSASDTSGTHVGLLRLLDIFGIKDKSFNIKAVIAFFLAGLCVLLLEYIVFRIGVRGMVSYGQHLLLGAAFKAVLVCGLVGSLLFVKTTNIFKLSMWVAIVTTAGDMLLILLFGKFSWFLFINSAAGHFTLALTLILSLVMVKREWVAMGLALFATIIVNQIVLWTYLTFVYRTLSWFRSAISPLLVGMGRAIVFALALWLFFKLFQVRSKPAASYKGFKAAIPQILPHESSTVRTVRTVRTIGSEGGANAADAVKAKGDAPFSSMIDEEEQPSGFFASEQRGIQKGVFGGIAMMVIAALWFFGGMAAGYIFYYPPILFVFGLYGFIKGLATGNLAGKKDEDDIDSLL
ncbi:MAG: hypothetical protein GY757_11420 [bacterium]|nr:hypothetical protein [bacterium]